MGCEPVLAPRGGEDYSLSNSDELYLNEFEKRRNSLKSDTKCPKNHGGKGMRHRKSKQKNGKDRREDKGPKYYLELLNQHPWSRVVHSIHRDQQPKGMTV